MIDPALGFLWLLFALVGLGAANHRGFSPIAGIIGGLLLGPLSVLLFWVSSSKVRCPHCAEWIHKQAAVCKHCGREVAPPAPSISSARRH